jgi:hypothetical protein
MIGCSGSCRITSKSVVWPNLHIYAKLELIWQLYTCTLPEKIQNLITKLENWDQLAIEPGTEFTWTKLTKITGYAVQYTCSTEVARLNVQFQFIYRLNTTCSVLVFTQTETVSVCISYQAMLLHLGAAKVLCMVQTWKCNLYRQLWKFCMVHLCSDCCFMCNSVWLLQFLCSQWMWI